MNGECNLAVIRAKMTAIGLTDGWWWSNSHVYSSNHDSEMTRCCWQQIVPTLLIQKLFSAVVFVRSPISSQAYLVSGVEQNWLESTKTKGCWLTLESAWLGHDAVSSTTTVTNLPLTIWTEEEDEQQQQTQHKERTTSLLPLVLTSHCVISYITWNRSSERSNGVSGSGPIVILLNFRIKLWILPHIEDRDS